MAPERISGGYTVSCPCGQACHGQRQARHQVLKCPRCGHAVFVLPRSPFHAHGAAAARRAPLSLAWLMPVVAGAITLSVLVALFFVLRPYLVRQGRRGDAALTLRQQIESGKQALARGAFQRAAEELRTAWQESQARPEALSVSELRELRDLDRQADLLAGLLSQSLQELLEQATATESDDEWQVRFRKDYLGKAIVLDAFARLDQKGRPELSLKMIQSGEAQARLAWDTVQLLADLSLGVAPRRVVFGVRLASFAREPGGRWVIGFQPDSGVLITDIDAFRACAPLSWTKIPTSSPCSNDRRTRSEHRPRNSSTGAGRSQPVAGVAPLIRQGTRLDKRHARREKHP